MKAGLAMKLFVLSAVVFLLMTTLFFGCSNGAGDDDVTDDDDAQMDDDAVADDDLVDDDQSDDDATDDDEPIVECPVREYGAVGDGQTLDTIAIQAAIDDCRNQGGGRVVFDPGDYYSGTVYLKSGVRLYLEVGATLIASKNEDDYTDEGLIWAQGQTDIGIEGEGTIYGNGEYWWPRSVIGLWRPSRLIKLIDCHRITIKNVLLTQSPKWTLHLLACDEALIDSVKIRNTVGNNYTSPNTDGIDLEACRDVEVAHCDIEAGDDCIALKNGEDEWRRDSYNISVHDCVLAGWANGFKIGTETERDFYNIEFRDSTIQASVDSNPGTRCIAGVALISDDGANLHDITISNIHMSEVQAPFFIRLQKRLRGDLSEPGTIDGIVLEDITVDDALLTASIQGIPEHNIDAITLSNIDITSSEGGAAWLKDRTVPEREEEYPDATYFGTYPAYGIYARHIDGCLRYDGSVTFASTAGDQRPEIVYDDVHGVDDSGLNSSAWVYDRTGDVEPCTE